MIVNLDSPEGRELLELMIEPRPICSNRMVPPPPAKEKLTPVPHRKAKRKRK